MLATIAELADRRIPMVYGQTAVVCGREPVVTRREFAAVAVVRRLHARFADGYYWHTENEQAAVAELMGTLVRRHAELRGLPPLPFPYEPALMVARQPPPHGAYSTIRSRPVDS